jgi:hypothetical protein
MLQSVIQGSEGGGLELRGGWLVRRAFETEIPLPSDFYRLNQSLWKFGLRKKRLRVENRKSWLHFALPAVITYKGPCYH